MTWNYRFIRHKPYEDGAYTIQLHEVYYNDKGEPRSCTLHPVNVYAIMGETVGESEEESLKELRQMIVAAFDKPILDMSIFDR